MNIRYLICLAEQYMLPLLGDHIYFLPFTALLIGGAQLNSFGNELLVILSILEKTSMPLQFVFLSPSIFFITSYFLTEKKTCDKTESSEGC